MQGRQAVNRRGPRTVEARSPSTRRETVLVGIAALVIVGAGLVLAPTPRRPVSEPGVVTELLPYQTLFRDLSADDQRHYREILEGMVEAENARSEAGQWPEVNALAATGAPPFAPNPTDKVGWHWSRQGRSPVFNYLGQPAAPGPSAFLVLIQETGDRLGFELKSVQDLDEQHHLLRTGEVIHFSVWRRDQAPTDDDLVILPMTSGWTQILVNADGGPKEAT